MKKLLVGAIALIFATNVQAADFDFGSGLSGEQVESIVEDFSNVFAHSSMSSAQSLGTVFGMEIGGYFNTADVPGISSINEGGDIAQLPMAGIYLAASSAGFTGELNYLPSFDANGASFDFTSIGLKWTLPDAFNPIPMGNLAARIFNSSVKLGFTYNPGAGNIDMTVKDSVLGIQGIWSQSFGVAEVFGGIGYLMADGSLSTSAPTGSPFADAGSTKESSSPSSFQYFVGGQLNLFVFRLAAEYTNQFGAGRTGLKFVFQF